MKPCATCGNAPVYCRRCSRCLRCAGEPSVLGSALCAACAGDPQTPPRPAWWEHPAILQRDYGNALELPGPAWAESLYKALVHSGRLMKAVAATALPEAGGQETQPARFFAAVRRLPVDSDVDLALHLGLAPHGQLGLWGDLAAAAEAAGLEGRAAAYRRFGAALALTPREFVGLGGNDRFTVRDVVSMCGQCNAVITRWAMWDCVRRKNRCPNCGTRLDWHAGYLIWCQARGLITDGRGRLRRAVWPRRFWPAELDEGSGLADLLGEYMLAESGIRPDQLVTH